MGKIYTLEEVKSFQELFKQAEILWATETKKWLDEHGEEWFPKRGIGFRVKMKYPRRRKVSEVLIVAPTGTPDSRALIATHSIVLEFLLSYKIDCFFDNGI